MSSDVARGRTNERRSIQFGSTLSLHMVDVRQAADEIHRVVMPRCISVSLLLRGSADVLGAGVDASFDVSRGAEGALAAFAEPHEITRRLRPGVRIRHVGIVVPQAWVARAHGHCAESARSVAAFAGRHLAMERWRLSPRATMLVEQMLQPTPYDPFLQELRFEAQALDLLAEAFGRLAGSAASTSRVLSAREHRRLHAVRELVESEAANGLSIDDIARHAGSNVTTLQQQFRATFGTTIFAALRDARMRRATDALQAGASVSEAAYIAGFASPANFSTAFKARFGIPPKQARARG